MPKIFGKEHIIFLIIFFSISFTSLILVKIKVKDKKYQKIYIKSLAFLTLIFNILCRIGVAQQYGIIESFPSTICSLTSFILPLMILFGKEDLPIYNGPFYIGLIGGISSLIYPDFISQGPTIFQLNTIMGLLHHGCLFILCLAMFIFNWFRPSIKNCYYFPLTICVYIAVGIFAIYKLSLSTAMLIDTPILSGTIIDIWFILIFGTILDYLVAFIYEVITKKIKFKFHE